MNRIRDRFPSFKGVAATVMGVGAFGGGVAAVRYLVDRGARVTVTDSKPEWDLEESLKELANLKLERTYLGEHPEAAFRDAELLIVNPGVRPGHPMVEFCRKKGATVTTEIELLLSTIAGRIIAVTGTNGKSTTAALTAHLLLPQAEASGSNVWLGGNIGGSLLEKTDQISASDFVVLELSSFQLQYLREAQFAPDIGVITNFSPNHIDWHGSVDAYRSAKQILFHYQQTNQVAILPADDDGVPWRVRTQVFRFATRDEGENGAFLENGSLILRAHSREDAIRLELPTSLRGQHNAINVAAAACVCFCLGLETKTFQNQLSTFQPLPHRLQFGPAGRGLRFCNDSSSTTPESTIAALKSFRSPVVLIAGGADKGIDLSELAGVIAESAIGTVLIGETSNTLLHQIQSLRTADAKVEATIAADFGDAVSQAVALAPEGGIVLLSPGCASYGWFRDFRDRGEQFLRLAEQWIQNS